MGNRALTWTGNFAVVDLRKQDLVRLLPALHVRHPVTTLGVNAVPLNLGHEAETLRTVVYFASGMSSVMLVEERYRFKLSAAATAAKLFEMAPLQMLPYPHHDKLAMQ